MPCMGFSDTVLSDRFPSVLENHLGDLTLEGYYCQTPDGQNMLFVIGAKEKLAFQFEAVDDEQVKLAEELLLSMGIDVKANS